MTTISNNSGSALPAMPDTNSLPVSMDVAAGFSDKLNQKSIAGQALGSEPLLIAQQTQQGNSQSPEEKFKRFAREHIGPLNSDALVIKKLKSQPLSASDAQARQAVIDARKENREDMRQLRQWVNQVLSSGEITGEAWTQILPVLQRSPSMDNEAARMLLHMFANNRLKGPSRIDQDVGYFLRLTGYDTIVDADGKLDYAATIASNLTSAQQNLVQFPLKTGRNQRGKVGVLDGYPAMVAHPALAPRVEARLNFPIEHEHVVGVSSVAGGYAPLEIYLGTKDSILQDFSEKFQQGLNVIGASYSMGENNGGYFLSMAERFPDVLFITSAGNDDSNYDETRNDRFINYGKLRFFTQPNIMVVASSDANGDLAYESNYGVPYVTHAARGQDVLLAVKDHQFEYGYGNSISVHQFSRTATLMRIQNPSLTPQDIKGIFADTAQKTPEWEDLVAAGGVTRLNDAFAVATLTGLMCYGVTVERALADLPLTRTQQAELAQQLSASLQADNTPEQAVATLGIDEQHQTQLLALIKPMTLEQSLLRLKLFTEAEARAVLHLVENITSDQALAEARQRAPAQILQTLPADIPLTAAQKQGLLDRYAALQARGLTENQALTRLTQRAELTLRVAPLAQHWHNRTHGFSQVIDTPGQQAQQGPGDQDLTALQELQQQQLKQQQLMQQQFVGMQQPSQQAQQGSLSPANSNDAALIKVLRSTQYVEDGQLADAGREAVQQLQNKLRKAYIKITAADAAYGVLAENSQGEAADLARSRFQGAVRQAVFDDLGDIFSRDDNFGRLDPLRRYREIYQRYKLDQNPLSIMDAIIGHQELVSTGVPKSPDAFMVKLKPYHIDQKMQRVFLQFLHEPHLLEGNPDNSIDNTNVRSLTTVNLYPKAVNDLSDSKQAAGLYKINAFNMGLLDSTNSSSVKIFGFLRGGEAPALNVIHGWKHRVAGLGIADTNNDIRDLGRFQQLYFQAYQALNSNSERLMGIGEKTMESLRDILKSVLARNYPAVSAEELQQQYVAGEAMRRVNGAAQQYRDAASAFLQQPLTDKSVAQVLNVLWQWADTTQMPHPDEVERVYQEIQQQGEYPVSDFEDAATAANKVFAYLRGEISTKELLAYMVQELLPGWTVSPAKIDTLDVSVLNTLNMVIKQKMKGESGNTTNTLDTTSPGTDADAEKNGPATDSLSDQVSDASSNALAEQYQGFAKDNDLFNLKDQQQNAGYTNFSLHKKIESGPGAIGVAPYDLPGLLSGKGSDLTTPVETGIDQSTPTEYTPAQIAPATFKPKSATPAEPTPEQDRLEQTVRNAYARLPAEVQATLTLEEFRQLDLTEIDLAQQYKDYTSLHRNVTHQDNKPPMRLADYIKFGPEIQQRLQQWSDQAKHSDKIVSTYQKQAQIYRDQATELQQLTQQIQQATAVLTAAQSVKPTQSVERITIPSRYPAAEMIPEQINKASNNIMNTTKAGAPVSGKASTNVPIISLKGKAGLDQYTQSSTIPKYLYKPNQQDHLQLHVVVESGNQLSLQAVPLSIHKPQVSMGTHYTPKSGWLNIPQLNAAQQNQINQYLQQSTFIMPGPVMAPAIPAGSSAPVPVPQVTP